MKLFSIITICLRVAACESSSLLTIVIETTAGDIVLEVDTVAATITATNFLRYVDGGFYAGGTFYGSVRMDNQPDNDIRIEVIQGGANTVGETSFFESIVLERTNKTGIKHLNGVISMAREGPDSATHSIFICIGDQPSLDFGGMRNPDGQGLGAFARVISGMDVVRLIRSGAVQEQTLIEPVVIERAYRRDQLELTQKLVSIAIPDYFPCSWRSKMGSNYQYR